MSLGNSILKSSLLLFLTKFINRGIGLVSTLILARLLTPEDYGIVAIAVLAIFLFEELSNTGIREYIIHKSPLSDAVLNTAWTLNLIIKLAVWGLFLLLIPLISDFYSIPELNNVLLVISLILPLAALKSVGAILFEKELNYKPLLYLELSAKLIGFVFIVSIALLFENYWAMIIGAVIYYLALVAGSYLIHNFRPRLSLFNFKEQWQFTKWMLPKGLLGFSKSEIDVLIVSKTFDLGNLGGFNLMKSLLSMVGEAAISPATNPLLASFSKVKDDNEKLNFQLMLGLFVIMIVSLPIMMFLWMFHKEIVSLLLGAQWVNYSSVLAVLSMTIVAYSFGGVLQHLLTSLGEIKIQFYYELFGLSLLAIFLLSISFDDLVEFTLVRTLIAILTVAVLYVYVVKTTALSTKALATLLAPVVLSLTISCTLVLNMNVGEDTHLLLYLLLHGVCFSIAYVLLTILTLYFYRGRAEIIYLRWLAEQTIKNIMHKVRSLKTRSG